MPAPIPFYQTLYRGVDCADAAQPLEKAVLQAALASFAPEREASGLYLVRSGGSTQAALIFPVDIAENLAQRQALADRLRADGVFGPASIALNLFGYANLYRTAAIVDDVLERCQATTLPMSAHAADADILAAARQFRPSHILGTPSRLALFAAHLEAADERLEIPQLLYAGEPCTHPLSCGCAPLWARVRSGHCTAARKPASGPGATPAAAPVCFGCCRGWRWRSCSRTTPVTAA
ncbi:hypothetical protein JOS77_30450 [Chromobacterium haemolyticum]|nr:hypothetical protein JOS77_30450 [Chromobacterium haemolyticum]